MDGVRLDLPMTDVMKTISPPKPSEDPRAAATRFESLLGSMLVKEMRGSLNEGFFGGGPGGDVYGGWLDEHIGAALAKRDALHLEATLQKSVERKARQSEVKP